MADVKIIESTELPLAPNATPVILSENDKGIRYFCWYIGCTFYYTTPWRDKITITLTEKVPEELKSHYIDKITPETERHYKKKIEEYSIAENHIFHGRLPQLLGLFFRR